MVIRIDTLGGLRAFAEGRELTWVGSRRFDAALLVYLGVERRATRSELQALLWPESPPRKGAHLLSQALYRLRRELGRDWVEVGRAVVRATEDLRCDALDFEEAAVEAPERALELYNGPFLAGDVPNAPSKELEFWVDRRRVELAQTHRAARRQVIAAALGRGAAEDAVAAARGWVAVEPRYAEAQLALVELLDRAGRAGDALLQYETYRRGLEAEEMETPASLRACAEAIRARGDPGWSPPATTPTILREAREAPLPLAGLVPPPRTSAGGRFGGTWSVAVRRAAAGTLVLAVGIVLGGRAPRSARPAPAAPPGSIAVLPLQEIGAGTDRLAERLEEDVRTALTEALPGVRVASATSSRAHAAQGLGARQLGRALAVRTVLEGYLEPAGEGVRLTLRLVDTRTGLVRWTRSWAAPPAAAPGLATRAAGELSQTLRSETTMRDIVAPPPPSSVRPDPHDLILRGTYFVRRSTRADQERALAHYRQAAELDPGLAQAWEGMAFVYHHLAGRYVPPAEGYRDAIRAAERARDLDPTRAGPHLVLGLANLYHAWDAAAARQAFLRALELDPDRPAARAGWAFHLLAAQGRVEDALEQIRYAVELDPLSASGAAQVARMLVLAGRHGEAIEQHRRVMELDPTFFRYDSPGLKALRYVGRGGESLAGYLDARRRLGRPSPGLGITYAMAGRSRDARRVLEELAAASDTDYVPSSSFARLHAHLGQPDSAFAWLERAYEDREGALVFLPFEPDWQPIRDDPRFADLVRRVGVAPP